MYYVKWIGVQCACLVLIHSGCTYSQISCKIFPGGGVENANFLF